MDNSLLQLLALGMQTQAPDILEAYRKHTYPNLPERGNRDELVKNHEKTIKSYHVIHANTSTAKINFQVGDRKEPTVKKSIEELRLITERELVIDKIHKGCVLLCKTLVDPFMVNALVLVAEDTKRNGVLLSIYELTKKEAYKIIKGTILAIKEPYFKCASDGNLIIRVDNPKNMVILQSDNIILKGTSWYKNNNNNHSSSSSTTTSSSTTSSSTTTSSSNISSTTTIPPFVTLPIPNTVTGWRTKATTCSTNNDHIQALYCWKQVLKLEPKDLGSILSIADIYLQYRDWENSLYYTNEALKLEENPSINLQKVKALMELEKYTEAKELLSSKSFRNANYDTEAMIEECSNKEIQVVKGKYIWDDILLRTLQIPEFRFDMENYQSKAIQIQTDGGKYTGIVAKRAIKEGELLVVSKAIQVIFPSELQQKLSLPENSSKLITDNSLLQDQILSMLDQHIYIKNQILKLSSNYSNNTEPLTVTKESDDEIRQIISNHAMEWFNGTSQYAFGEATLEKGKGFWLVPSYFTHSYFANCSYTFLGDILIIHAACTIKPGEELTLCKKQRIFDIKKNSLSPLRSGGLDWRLIGSTEAPEELQQIRKMCLNCEIDVTNNYLPIINKLWNDIKLDMSSLSSIAIFLSFHIFTMISRYYLLNGHIESGITVLEYLYNTINTQPAFTFARQEQIIRLCLQLMEPYIILQKVKKAELWEKKALDHFLRYWEGSEVAYNRIYQISHPK